MSSPLHAHRRSPRLVLALRAAWLVGALLAVAGVLIALGEWALPPASRPGGGSRTLPDALATILLHGAAGAGFGAIYGALGPAPQAPRRQQRRAGLLAGGAVALGLGVLLAIRVGGVTPLLAALAVGLILGGLGLGAWAGPRVHRLLHGGLGSAT